MVSHGVVSFVVNGSPYCKTGMHVAFSERVTSLKRARTVNYVKCFTIILCVIIALPTSASDDLWIARLDSETTGISVDDPLAISKLSRQVRRIEQRDGQFTHSLYQPLRQLGILQAKTDPEAAIDSFRRMQNLVHRHFGVLSDVQFESVDLLIGTYIRNGNLIKADTQQEFRFRVAKDAFEPSTKEYHYAGLKLADWYRNTMRYSLAGDLYEDAAAHFASRGSKDQVRVLRAQALNEYLSGQCCAESKLSDALNIASASGVSEGTELLDLKKDVIDMRYLMSEGQQTALNDDHPLDLPAALLGYAGPRSFHAVNFEQHIGKVSPWTTVMLFEKEEPAFGAPKEAKPIAVGSPIPFCTSTYDSLVRNGDSYHLDIAVNVDAMGRPSTVSVEGDAPIGLVRLVKNSLREVVYRPAIEAGTAVDDGVVSFTQTFDAMSASFSSQNRVETWNRQLVAQSCQLVASYI